MPWRDRRRRPRSTRTRLGLDRLSRSIHLLTAHRRLPPAVSLFVLASFPSANGPFLRRKVARGEPRPNPLERGRFRFRPGGRRSPCPACRNLLRAGRDFSLPVATRKFEVVEPERQSDAHPHILHFRTRISLGPLATNMQQRWAEVVARLSVLAKPGRHPPSRPGPSGSSSEL
jgi:hypothetical protein